MTWHFCYPAWDKSQTTLLKPRYSNRSFITAQRRKREYQACIKSGETPDISEMQGIGGTMVLSKGSPGAKQAPAKKSKAPIATFAAGGVKVSVWENVNKDETGTYYTAVMTRSYKDDKDTWQETQSLRSHDIAKAQLVLSKAFEFINLTRSETGESDSQ